METAFENAACQAPELVRNLPLRNGNPVYCFEQHGRQMVRNLPLRNGNELGHPEMPDDLPLEIFL